MRGRYVVAVGGGAGLLGAASIGLLWGEAKLARHVIKPPAGVPGCAGLYGDGDGEPFLL